MNAIDQLLDRAGDTLEDMGAQLERSSEIIEQQAELLEQQAKMLDTPIIIQAAGRTVTIVRGNISIE